MELTIIHGQAHQGSTYHISQLLREKLTESDTVVHEYFLPKDTPAYCVGCFQCIQKDELLCPGAEKTQKILESMLRSEIIIIDSPTYCYEMTGQLKTLFDHLGYIWLAHRPRKEMFRKIGIVVSTTAGAGAGNVTKSLKRQLFWWGVPKIHTLPVSVKAASWKEVKSDLKEKLDRDTTALAKKVKFELGKAKPGLKHLLLFNVFRKMQAANVWNAIDSSYWKDNGWLGKVRPWR